MGRQKGGGRKGLWWQAVKGLPVYELNWVQCMLGTTAFV